MKSAETVSPKTNIVLDLGKKSKKQLKKLRKGKGNLMVKVNATLAELEENGTIAPGSTVVVVATQKKKSKGLFNIFG